MAATGVFGLVRPQELSALLLGSSPGVLLYAGAGLRAVLGVIFLLAAPSCRFPRTMVALGYVALAAAAAVLLLGAARIEGLVQWWFRQPEAVIRSAYGGTVLFGGFLVYSGSRRP